MRLNFVIMALVAYTAQLQAQEVLMSSSRNPKPTWVGKPDTSFLAGDYYFFYAKGEANSESKAESMAGKAVIIQIAMLEGCSVTVEDVIETSQQQEGKSFKINKKYYSVSKSVCKNISTKGYKGRDFYLETWKRGDSTFYRYYLWASMLGPKLINPNKAMSYSIFPGGGQMYKEEYWRTAGIWGGLALTGYGIGHFASKANEWRDAALGYPSNFTRRNEMERYESQNRLAMAGCGVLALGGYIWNLYDARHHTNSRIRTAANIPRFKLQQYHVTNHSGIMLTYKLN